MKFYIKGRTARHIKARLALGAVLLVSLWFLPAPAISEEVTLTHKQITLNGNLELADGKAFSDGIILITHGTLAHNKMEIIATLQSLFRERELSTLAINLSLGVSNRHGPYDCATPHTHRHTDAIDEIAAWIDWLGERGTDKIVVMGHSRGGNQTAWYLAENADDQRIRGGVLIAPATWDPDKAAKSYLKQYKKPLPELLESMKQRVAAGKGDQMIENVDMIYCPKTTVTANAFVNYYEDNPLRDTPQTLKRVSKPVMVIAGSEDAVVTDLPEKMAKASLQNVRFEVLEGARHFFRDLYSDDIADLTVEFMENLP